VSPHFLGKWGTTGSGDGQFVNPALGIAPDSSDNIYVADWGNNRIQKFDSNGNFITKWGTQGSGDGQFDEPTGIAIDSSGNVYVVDRGNSRIQVFAPQ
jgi:DNA-binding beta-propeller fold protein YncE